MWDSVFWLEVRFDLGHGGLEPCRADSSHELLRDHGTVYWRQGQSLRGCVPLDERHLIKQPVFARAVIAHLARRHARLTERLEHLFFVELDERLAAFLLERVSDDGYAPPTNSELASILGTVPELVSRTLGEF